MLAKGIVQHGAGEQMRRVTLFAKVQRSPESSLSRQLVTNSSRYGLTTGSYGAEYLKLTPDGAAIADSGSSRAEFTRKAFELGITRIPSFARLYDRLKNKRMPSMDVLTDELARIGVTEPDRRQCAEVFIANARYLGLIAEVAGSDRLVPIEQALEALSDSEGQSATPEAQIRGIEERPNQQQIPRRSATVFGDPSVQINIQIHIDASASADQIDQIFASMRRHLYHRTGE